MAKAKSKLVEKAVEKPAVKVIPTKEVPQTKEVNLGGDGHPSRDFGRTKK